MLAPWVIEHMPEHRVYVEPFGGAASVLLRKPKAYAEIYNDLDDDVVNLFSVLRSDKSDILIHALSNTPFARSEFQLAYEETSDPVERARRLVVRSFMGFGSDAATTKSSGFRANSNRSGSTPAHDWANYPSALQHIVERLSGCVIECRPEIEVMLKHDTEATLHYVDPPYMHSTRVRHKRKNYRHEMTDGDHEHLLSFLCELEGKVILSGYPNELYDDFLTDWIRVERGALADGALKRTEVLWMNFNGVKQESLFGSEEGKFNQNEGVNE